MVFTPQCGSLSDAVAPILPSMRGRPLKAIPKFPNRLRELRLKRGLTQVELAKRAHYTQQTVQRYETGDRQLKVEQLDRFATALGCDPTDILPGSRGREIAVVGYVGAGAEIFPIDDHARGDGLREVACPAPLDPSTTVAVQVRGDSMLPIQDGWILFYSRQHEAPGFAVMGHLCVVKVAGEGPTLVKQVRRGYSPGRFNLISTNAAPLEDVELEWAARVRAILPPGEDEASE